MRQVFDSAASKVDLAMSIPLVLPSTRSKVSARGNKLISELNFWA